MLAMRGLLVRALALLKPEGCVGLVVRAYWLLDGPSQMGQQCHVADRLLTPAPYSMDLSLKVF
jgi:hypothetical protein